MLLVDDGRVSLDDPIARWLPELESPRVVRTPESAIDDVVPAATSGSGVRAYVGGETSLGIDLADQLGARLPWFFAAVLTLSFLLLMVVFRSLLVPLKAVVMNLLSVSAAYGIIVAIFQWGWAKNLFGIGKEGPIDAWIPMMLFAITFGLSMDYEVFLLSRIREEYDRTGDNALAVAEWISAHPKVDWVSYPGLPGDRYHNLAKKYCPLGAGAVFTFGLKGGYEAGVELVSKVKLFSHLANVGDTKSLIIHPASTTHKQLSDAQKVQAGAGPDVVRLSIGIEDKDDIIADLEHALAD